MNAETAFRLATAADLPALLEMMHALAAFEKIPGQMRVDAEELRAMLFGPAPGAVALLACRDEVPVGYALLVSAPYVKRGMNRLLMEDFYLSEATRAQGVGRELMAAVVRYASDNGYFRVEWLTYDWNAAALSFYAATGATLLEATPCQMVLIP